MNKTLSAELAALEHIWQGLQERLKKQEAAFEYESAARTAAHDITDKEDQSNEMDR